MKVHLSKDPKEVQDGVNEPPSRESRQCKGLEAAAGWTRSTSSKEASRVSNGAGRCGG